MNGPSHYREAQEWAQLADDCWKSTDDLATVAAAVAMAQVHATLAHTAATIAAASTHDRWPHLDHADAWTGILA